MKFLLQFVLLISFYEIVYGDIPRMKCKKHDPQLNQCVKDYANVIIAECQKGNKEIIPLNPYVLDYMELRPNDNLVFRLTNAKIFFSPITIIDLQLNLLTGSYIKNLTAAIITFDCDYCAVGTLNDKSISACGHAIITITGGLLNYRTSLIIKTLPSMKIYQVVPGTCDLSVGPTLFGLAEINCDECNLSEADELKLKDSFSQCGNDLIIKTNKFACELLDDGFNAVLRVQDIKDILTD